MIDLKSDLRVSVTVKTVTIPDIRTPNGLVNVTVELRPGVLYEMDDIYVALFKAVRHFR